MLRQEKTRPPNLMKTIPIGWTGALSEERVSWTSTGSAACDESCECFGGTAALRLGRRHVVNVCYGPFVSWRRDDMSVAHGILLSEVYGATGKRKCV